MSSHRRFRTTLFLSLTLGIPRMAASESPVASNPGMLEARIAVDVDVEIPACIGDFLGTNLPLSGNYAAKTTGHPAFIDSVRRLGPRLIRWPGGNISDHHNWKTKEIILPGRRRSSEGMVNLEDMIVFSRKMGAELSITINFGTMSADDAADMVELCNGPSTSFWGHFRDSLLTRHGFQSGPLNVRFFEIGNETYGRHMYEHSWTAQNPTQYFLGGIGERRGTVRVRLGSAICHIPLGDLFEIRSGDSPNSPYYLRFPPVRDVTVIHIPDRSAAESCFCGGDCDFALFTRVTRLAGLPPDTLVYLLDETDGTIRFGDGVHGFRPPVGAVILVEYTTHDQHGFVEYAEKMRAAQSSVPIKIGATMLPRHPTLPESTWVPEYALPGIFEQMDFLVVHHYLPTDAPPASSFGYRRQVPTNRVAEQDSMFRLFRQASMNALGYEKDIGLAITEWNLFNKNDSLVALNRSLEAALSGAEWLLRTMLDYQTTPVWYAEQFDLAAEYSKFALIQTDSLPYMITPLGRIFQVLKTWTGGTLVQTAVRSPLDPSGHRQVPLIYAAAARTPSGDTIRVAVTNNSERDSVACALDLGNFEPLGASVQWLTGKSPRAGNGGADPVVFTPPSILARPDSFAMPPHSVAFLTYSSATSSVQVEPSYPRTFHVSQNFPNPFNPRTTIAYRLSGRTNVRLTLYNLAGQLARTLVDEIQEAGEHRVVVDGARLSSGIYLYTITAGGHTEARKCLLLK